MKRSVWVVLVALGITGCTVGPNYKQPKIAVPAEYRGSLIGPGEASIADKKWSELFEDQTLTKLLQLALDKNFDIRIAAERVQQARGQLGVTRANQFPFLDAQAQFNAARGSSVGSFRFLAPGTNLSVSYTQAGAGISWDADLFGRLRRLTESARAQYFASEEGRRAVIVSLVGDVMSSYFSLLELDLELDISRKTKDIASNNLRLVGLRHDRGAANGLELRQAEQFLYTATAQIAAVERLIGQTEDGLSLLLGDAPHGIERKRNLEDFASPPSLPSGLPSRLVARRPDIRQAEQNLIAANAQIGAARALFFPNISLTGLVGGQSRALTDILSGPARLYSLVPNGVLPIFRAGQIRSQVRIAEAQQRELLLAYERAILTALREVSDSLIGHDRTRAQRTQQELLVKALVESERLSNLRYRGGLDSYLQVLDAERNLFQGQLVLSQLRLQETLSVVQLYRALGGGWE